MTRGVYRLPAINFSMSVMVALQIIMISYALMYITCLLMQSGRRKLRVYLPVRRL